VYDVGGWRLASRPNLRDGLEDDTHVQVSNVCRFRQGKNRLQARRFFSNTFASEEIDEKKKCVSCCDTDLRLENQWSPANVHYQTQQTPSEGCFANVNLGRSRIVSDRRH
jgi:hypothetical protein